MSKFDRAYEIFKQNNDRKVAVAAIAAALSVTEANAGVYFYKCVKKQEATGEIKVVAEKIEATVAAAPKKVKEEKPAKRVAVPSKIETKHYDKLEPMTEDERNGTVIPDFIPDFLLSDAQLRIRNKARDNA